MVPSLLGKIQVHLQKAPPPCHGEQANRDNVPQRLESNADAGEAAREEAEDCQGTKSCLELFSGLPCSG